jgi:hypothetical protein
MKHMQLEQKRKQYMNKVKRDTHTHDAISSPPRSATSTQHLSANCNIQSTRIYQAQYCYYLYTNNVKMYEISTSKYLHLHIVLSIYFRVYNLMMATWGPKHLVVNSIPPTLSNYAFSCVYDCCSHLILRCSLYTAGMSHLKIKKKSFSFVM